MLGASIVRVQLPQAPRTALSPPSSSSQARSAVLLSVSGRRMPEPATSPRAAARRKGLDLNYWMLTISPENFEVTRGQGFQVQGFGQRQRRKTERMSPGDRLMFYIKDTRVFPVAATMTSKAFEDRIALWHSEHPEELFPYRVTFHADAVLPEGSYLDAADIAPRLEYIKRWPPERWPLAFQGELHLLPRHDFDLLEAEMRRVLRKNGGRSRSGSGQPPHDAAPQDGTPRDAAPQDGAPHDPAPQDGMADALGTPTPSP